MPTAGLQNVKKPEHRRPYHDLPAKPQQDRFTKMLIGVNIALEWPRVNLP
ncbi:MAG: hypothetical protein U0894_16230 [Pirellulales bacterium]